jgi:spore coat polysaccharide biosynthesis protein SpsF
MSIHQPHIGIITQARMTSTRLPGKILKEVKNKTLLDYHIDRLKQTGLDIAIATTTNATDDVICSFSEERKLKFHRGSENNVLSRYYETALKYKFDIVIRVTSDCPLIDPHLIRNGVEKYMQLNNPNLYISNGIERTFARGFDFEILSFQLLEDAYLSATEDADLEHVTPYIWKNRSGKVEFYHVKQNVNNGGLRITVDTADDFELIKTLIEKYNAETLSYNEIENILLQHPELVALNEHIEQKKV